MATAEHYRRKASRCQALARTVPSRKAELSKLAAYYNALAKSASDRDGEPEDRGPAPGSTGAA